MLAWSSPAEEFDNAKIMKNRSPVRDTVVIAKQPDDALWKKKLEFIPGKGLPGSPGRCDSINRRAIFKKNWLRNVSSCTTET